MDACHTAPPRHAAQLTSAQRNDSFRHFARRTASLPCATQRHETPRSTAQRTSIQRNDCFGHLSDSAPRGAPRHNSAQVNATFHRTISLRS